MMEEQDMDHRTTEAASASSGHPAVPMLDLQQFCGADEFRPYLMKPFSRNGFTYAANGHIMVRVALRADVPETTAKFDPEKPLKGIDQAKFFHPSFELPPAPTERGECVSCSGRGYEHDCPDCECICERCHGSGNMDIESRISASVGPTPFSLHYIRQMLSLPGIEIEELPVDKSEKPLFFRFEGGVGALMPLHKQHIEHIDIKLRKDP
jgi:hypothetical protein